MLPMPLTAEKVEDINGLDYEGSSHQYFCGLCTPLLSHENWSSKCPNKDDQKWTTLLESKVHVNCLEQARVSNLLSPIKLFEKNEEEDERVFGNRVLEGGSSPLFCVFDSKKYTKNEINIGELYGQTEIQVMAQHPFASGFRLYPQTAPPRTLEDMFSCTSKLSRNGRLAESSLPTDVKSKFPQLNKTLRENLPEFVLPGGHMDVLWRDSRNRNISSNFKLVMHSPGSTRPFRISRYRAANLLLGQSYKSIVLEWAGISAEDTERILSCSEAFRSKEDLMWIPTLEFCLRNGIKVYCGTLSQPGQIMISNPGCASWCFVRSPAIMVDWSFAERSLSAFRYVLSLNLTKPELEVDVPNAADDILDLKFFTKLMNVEQERTELLPTTLSKAILSKLLNVCTNKPELDPQIRENESETRQFNKERCDHCRCELFDRFIFCPQCEHDGHDPSEIIELQASHPPRSKKDRSILPDWLRVGCRVLVNLTVSGNSNDRPPRVVGASHLPGILLKTGHGFFTVYLEGAGETVVKRRAALEPHPNGPGLARGFQVVIRADGTGEHYQTATCHFKTCVYCVRCFKSAHAKRNHSLKDCVYQDLRKNLTTTLNDWESEINSLDNDGQLWTEPYYQDDVMDEEIPTPPKLLRTVSAEAGADAMAAAQVMGPSPYHYSSNSSNGNSNGVASHGDGERRKARTSKKRQPSISEPSITHEKPIQKKEESITRTTSVPVVPVSSSSVSTSKKRVRAHSPSLNAMNHSELFSEDFLAHTATLLSKDLPDQILTGSFFVGGRDSMSVALELDTSVDDGKSDEVKAIWARARRSVPLKKVWKFLSSPAKQPSNPEELIPNSLEPSQLNL